MVCSTMQCSLCDREHPDLRRRRCNSCNTKIRRCRTKIAAVQMLGGRCGCGYTLAANFSNIAAFEFHHVKGKEFTIGNVANRRWEAIVKELRKCRLTCSNCHRIQHSTREGQRLL